MKDVNEASRARVKADRRIFAHSFQPAASPKALTRISREIRSWALHHRSDKSLNELAQMYNPCIRGWITYYGPAETVRKANWEVDHPYLKKNL